MKFNIHEPARVICSNPNGIHNYFAWPSIARLQDGSLMAVASGFRIAHVCPFGKVVAIRSYDEGRTWSSPSVIIDTPLDDRDGGITPFGEKGVIVTSFTNSPDFQRKHAEKHPTQASPYINAYLDEIERRSAWEGFLGSTLTVSRDCGASFGKPMLAPVSSPHGPCVLSDGTIFYVGRPFDDSELPCHIECHTLSPEGSTELRSRISDIAPELLSCEPHAIQLKSGRIIVHIRVQGALNGKKLFTIYQSISDDNGYTFTEPVQLLSDRGGSPAHLLEHSSGRIVSVYGYREAPYGIRAMFSDDGGETWDTDNILVDDEPSKDLGYPASAELSDGRILTVYYAKGTKGESVIKQMIWSI